ncbi:hypothetical protein CEXT_278431 [Caerostris extrusa]|uniref:Ribosomal protein L20 n=1 Tax=Caerostris extrusa TaxID=172846 RepID=A0AAV4PG29_CAEEX|nr:hypothetical protein CEXT_278431 [Caerostris extrusa]
MTKKSNHISDTLAVSRNGLQKAVSLSDDRLLLWFVVRSLKAFAQKKRIRGKARKIQLFHSTVILASVIGRLKLILKTSMNHSAHERALQLRL